MLSHATIHHGFLLPDVNSTKLRAILKKEQKQPCQLIDRTVDDYIRSQGLYS